jgi:hypothetical protein
MQATKTTIDPTSDTPVAFSSLHDDATSISAANREPILLGNSNRIRGANKPRMPFDAAARRIVEHGRGLANERVTLTHLRVDGDRIITKDREFHVNHEGFGRLCGHLRAPSDYLEKLPPKLRNDLLTFHLQSLGRADRGLNDSSSHLVHRNGTFIDLGRADLRRLGAGEVLDAVREGFDGDADTFEVEELEIDHEAFRLDIVSPRVATEVRRGDVIQAGVRVEHAYTGERATTVLAFVVRLICSNGMVHRECLGSSRRTPRTRRLNADREDAGMLQIEQIRSLTIEARKGLQSKLDAIRKLEKEPADVRQLHKFLRQARVPGVVVKRVEDAWAVEDNEQTAFGLFNALTRLATYGADSASLRPGESALSTRQRGILARLAGIYANQSNHSLCPHCFSAVNS